MNEESETEKHVINVDFAMPPALARYWTTGEGGVAKIRWGTDGDLTRCHRLLREYIPSSEARWGTCNNLHKRLFGVPNPRD